MTARVVALACGLAAALGGCGGEPSPRAAHERMVRVLGDLAAQAERTNVFFGRARLDENRAELERLGAQAPWRLRLDVATAELQRGNEREAIGLLAATRTAMQRGELAADVDGAVAVTFYLGVAYMRLGETENCCARPSQDACILPLSGKGLHDKTEGAANAAELFLEVAHNTAKDAYWHLAARWMLTLAHQALGTFPDGIPERFRIPAERFRPEAAFPRFFDIAPAVGLDTWGLAGGAIADDFDGDDHLDVVVSDWSPTGQLRFYRNERDGTFADRTTAAGLAGITGGLNLVQADYDGDGDLDVLVLRGGWWFETGCVPNSLLQNDGAGRFTDVTFAVGLAEPFLPTQTGAFADYDLDGDLDLFVGNENSSRIRAPSQLFRNDGGRFADVAAAAGVTNDRYCKGVTWGDYDGDRWPDLYVSNIDGDNRLYRNRGDGTFEDVASRLQVTRPKAGFPTWFFDFDDDGVLDIFAANYDTGIGHLAAHLLGQRMPFDRACLYRGDGKGGFEEIGARAGLAFPAMPMGCNFGDVDNDGDLDVYLGTGDPQFYSLMPNLLLRNDGGARLTDVTIASGTGHLQKGHGVSFADLDHDGDQDLFMVVGGAYPGDAYRNVLFENPGFGNRWLTVHCQGRASNRCAIGARIRVVVHANGAERAIHRHVNSGGSFGCSPLRQTIGLGKAERIVRVEVLWPKTGQTQVVEGVPMDAAIRIVEGEPGFAKVLVAPVPVRRG